jgi:hypothetical protein
VVSVQFIETFFYDGVDGYPEEQDTLFLKSSVFTQGIIGRYKRRFGLFRINVEKKVFLDSGKTVRKPEDFEGLVVMADAVITEHAGTRQGPVTRFYQYGREGVQVLDTRKNLQRLYIFDPSSDMMTERDPLHREKIFRRFVFDLYGMLEETFSFGQSPRTFRYENGGQQIAVREGGQYGAVGKIFTFEGNGLAETAWGRHGEIERVYIFEGGNDAITIRKDGWFGTVDRTLVFEGIDASVFREPEAFLQFLIFTEWREGEMKNADTDRGADVASRDGSRVTRSRYAFTGKRHTSSDTPSDSKDDPRIDIIPEGDCSLEESPGDVQGQKKSSEISFAERQKGHKT